MQLNTLSFVMAPSHNISDIQKNDKLSTFRVCPTNTPFKEKSDLILLPSPFRIEEGKGDDIPITDRDKSPKSMIDSLAGLSVKSINSHHENNKFDQEKEVLIFFYYIGYQIYQKNKMSMDTINLSVLMKTPTKIENL